MTFNCDRSQMDNPLYTYENFDLPHFLSHQLYLSQAFDNVQDWPVRPCSRDASSVAFVIISGSVITESPLSARLTRFRSGQIERADLVIGE